jgi:rubrerythrin
MARKKPEMLFKDAAITMELKIRDFYRKMAKKVRNAKSREILEFLADEELRHSRVIEDMTRVEIQAEQLNQAFVAAGDIMSCLTEDVMEMVALSFKLEEEEEILKMALNCEKDTLLFYRQLGKFVSDPDLQGQVDRLKEFEEDHIRELLVLRNVLNKEKSARHPTLKDIVKTVGEDE